MLRVLILSLLISGQLNSQITENIPIVGNHSNLCFKKTENIQIWDSLPTNINNASIIMFFSGSTSSLTENDLERLIEFVEKGGGLYLGSENWPLQAESNQLTYRLYNKECYGEFNREEAQVNYDDGNLHLDKSTVPAGTTTVAFPMDHRLTVEAWVDDQPLILSGNIGDGTIIIDGGYSRFYCDRQNEQSDSLFEAIVNYLKRND